jgi:hypothetical protein
LFRKKGLLLRIYGENIGAYDDFLQALPQQMVDAIKSAPICKRLVHGACSPKCSGYDFVIRGERYQKCRYACFEFLVADESNPSIKTFVENELKERAAV